MSEVSIDETKIQSILNEAQKKYFLGFGYHEENLRKLNYEKYKTPASYGTGFEVGDLLRGRMIKYWNITIYNTDCYKFFEQHGELS